MASHDDELTLEELDEQIDALARMPQALPIERQQAPTSQLIQHLSHLYQQDQATAQAVDTVRQRLQERGAVPARQRQHARRAGPPRQQESGPPPRAYAPAAPRRRGLSTRLLTIAAAVLLVVVVSGLVAGLVLVRQHGPVISNQPTAKPGQTAAPGQTAISTPTPCATRPTATAEAWFPYVSGSTNFVRGQVMGTINNGLVTTLSDFHYPLGIGLEGIDKTTSPHYLAWSPDAHYLAAGVTAYYSESNLIYPYLIDTTTHATTPIPQPMGTDGLPLKSWPEGRYFAWADNHTLLLFYGSNTQAQGSAGPTYSYDVNTKALTQLPGVQNAAEGIVRCSTLFYLELTPATKEINQQNGYTYYEGTALLHRYDLNTHTDIGQPVNIGSTFAQVPGPPDRPSVPSWDVSQDGKTLVYVQGAFWAGNEPITQQYLLENVDGSDARGIPTNQIPNWTQYFQTFQMSLSPDGQFVAIEATSGNAPIFTLNVDTGAYRAYGNPYSGAGLTEWGGPQWFKDSSGFDVVNTQSTGQSVADPYISRYLLSTPPGADGYIPGTVIAPEAQALALLS